MIQAVMPQNKTKFWVANPGRHWPRKGYRPTGMRPWRPPFHVSGSLSSQGSHFMHFKQKSQFTRPLLRKFWNFSLYSLNFHPNFSSQASKFRNLQFTSPQIWKFSVHKPPSSGANITSLSSQTPHFGNPGRGPHTPTWKKKKVECPPPR